MEENIMSFFKFEELRVYHRAVEYSSWLAEQSMMLQDEAEQRFLQMLVKASTEIAINIAEGSSNYKSLFVEKLNEAKSIIRKCVVYTDFAKDSHIFDEQQSNCSLENLMELTKMIGAMISSYYRPNKTSSKDKDVSSSYGIESAEFNY